MIALHDPGRQHRPYLADLRAALDAVLESGWFILGERGRRFESSFAAWCGARHAVGVANGTDALAIALRASGVVAGDIVATVANAGGYASCAIHACSATPLYVDVDEASMNVDLLALEAALSHRPRAVVVTHLYGVLAPVADAVRLCASAGSVVVEDCAQAHGARGAGTLGALGCFSFYPTKNLGALGDAGAIVTNDDALAARVRSLRQYGWSGKYQVMQPGGCNSRLDEMQAALLDVKLPHLAAEIERRREIARAYVARIDNTAIRVPMRGGEADAAHLFVVRSARRDALAAYLAAQGIETAVHYPVADHRQPAFASRYAGVNLPVTERLTNEILTLPCHPAMTDEEVSRVVAACNGFAG